MSYETFNPADSDFNNKRRANPVRVLPAEKLNSELSANEVRDLIPPYDYPTLISKESRADGLITDPNDNEPYHTIPRTSLPEREKTKREIEKAIKGRNKSENISTLLGFIVCLIPLMAIALFIFIPWYYALLITLLSTAIVAYFIFKIK
ncbi:hypothetical protein GW758_01325 [Candidatus Falkowbacteria bacterium]|nr:hypothetical protein [Candidatus Falkowbacteria bacterium]